MTVAPRLVRFLSWPGRLLAAGLLIGGCLSGCGPRGPVVAFVEGEVVLDGKAVEGATVSFSPTDASGLPALGKTDASGRFNLTSTRGGTPNGGAVVGRYAVSVSKIGYDLGGKQPPADGDYSGVPVRHFVPAAYGEASSSGLSAEVARGRNSFRFELSSGGGRSP